MQKITRAIFLFIYVQALSDNMAISVDLNELLWVVQTLPATEHAYIEDIYKRLSRCIRVGRDPTGKPRSFHTGDVMNAWLRVRNATENIELRALCDLCVAHLMRKQAEAEKASPQFLKTLGDTAGKAWLRLIQAETSARTQTMTSHEAPRVRERRWG